MSNRILDPSSVAIVGASADASKHTARPLRYLKKHGFKGRIFPVNPRADEIDGERAYPSISSIDEPIDHVLVMVPAPAVAGVIDECVQAKVAAATIYTDGFAERGDEGLAEQIALRDRARAGGLRLLGPNTMGYINFHSGCTLSPNMILEMDSFVPGDVSLVSQSGSMIGALLSRGTARGVRFSKLVSIGNEADLSVGNVVDMLVDDANTQTIMLFLESLRNSTDLATAARRAHAAGKVVVAYKLGRSELGREIAASHSGALTGPAATASAFFADSGIVEVRVFESLFESIALVSGRRPPDLRRQPRVAIVSTTGAAAALVGDQLASDGVDLIRPTPEVKQRLGAHGVELSDSPIMDLTMAGSRDNVYGDALDAILSSSNADAVVAIVGSSGQFVPEIAVKPIARQAQAHIPVVSFIGPNAPTSLELLHDASVPAYRTPESCAESLRAFLSWRSPVVRDKRTPIDNEAISAMLRSKVRLSEVDAINVFKKLDINTTPAVVITTDEIPGDLEYPVVAKVLSVDIQHKTDVGGVILNIQAAEELADAIKQIRTSVAGQVPGANIEGILVQPMQTGIAEAIVGFVRDAEVGPMVMVGAGGAMTELLSDVAWRCAPVSIEIAREMISEVRSFEMLRGFRNLPTGDLEGLAATIRKFSELAHVEQPTVLEAEINPVLIASDGVVALDGLINTDEA